MTTYRDYELPQGRSMESFTFQIGALHDGLSVDEIVTDERDEAFRILGATLEQGYAARFRHQEHTRTFVEATP